MDYASSCLFILLSTAMLATSAVIDPNRAAFTPVRCDRVPFTQRTGNHLRAFQDADVNQCFPIVNKNVPTEVFLHHERSSTSGCAHAVISYTGSDCEEYKSVGTFPLSFGQAPVVLNERKPICSFRLRYIPLTNDPITVKFGGGYGVVEMTRTRNECYNLCGQDGQDTHRPTWVGVYDSSQNIVTESDNYISLFSKNDCVDESILSYANGETKVTYETDLNRLTQSESNKNILSFRVAQIRRAG